MPRRIRYRPNPDERSARASRTAPGCPFECYADDAIVHCKTRRQAEYVLGGIAARMQEVGLTLHPEKTRIMLLQGWSARGRA